MERSAPGNADPDASTPRRPPHGMVVMIAALGVLLVVASIMTWRRPIVIDAPRSGGSGETQATPWPDMRVNVNTAPAAELGLLPGIGELLAERIVNDREENGPFQSLDDLNRVPGVGPVIIDRLRPFATVNKEKSVE